MLFKLKGEKQHSTSIDHYTETDDAELLALGQHTS